ncbi:MAG: GIY-YIG nuclease family protein [Nitrospirota bacterium]
MDYFVYILWSESTSRFYIGHTNNLVRRIAQHNNPDYHGSHHTKRNRGHWKCVYHEQFETRSEAMAREKEIKAKKSRAYIESLISTRQSPESIRD